MSAAAARRWGLALAGAVLLHVAALGLSSVLNPPATPPVPAAKRERPLVFTRVGIQNAPSGPARSSPSPSVTAPPRLARPPVVRAPEPTTQVEASPVWSAASEAATDGGEGGEGGDGLDGGSGGAPGSQTGSGLPSEGAVVAASGPAPNEDPSAAVHTQLARAADRCYPAAARRFRQTGVVEVHFCVGEGGVVQSAEVTHASGAPLLDGAVTRCVLPSAAPFPASASGRCFALPVRFGGAQ